MALTTFCGDTCCVCGAGVDDAARVVDFLDRKLKREPVRMCIRCFTEWPLGEGWRVYAKRIARLANSAGASA